MLFKLAPWALTVYLLFTDMVDNTKYSIHVSGNKDYRK